MAHKRGRESRADRLGEALRANLRRRKLASASGAAGDGGQSGGNVFERRNDTLAPRVDRPADLERDSED